MPEHFFFYLGLSLILVHEMDSVRCREWKIIPGLSLLTAKTGGNVFVLAHVPIYILLFLGLINPGTREGLIKGLNIFFIIHVGLHILFIKHKKNEFKDWVSWTIILGIGISALLDLIIFK